MSVFPGDHNFVIKILHEKIMTLLQYDKPHLHTGWPHVELPLGEVDDPAVGDGLIALGTLAVIPEPHPGVFMHLAPNLLPHHFGLGTDLHLVLAVDLHHQPPSLIIQPHRARSSGEGAKMILKSKKSIWFNVLLKSEIQ